MKILGYDYTVVCKDSLDSIGAMGRCNTKTLTIQLANDISQQQLVSTMLHEIIEAANYHLHLELSERHIMSIEASLYQTFTDNGVSLLPLLDGITNK